MFKIGDRVRVTDNIANEEWFDVGDEGTVSKWDGRNPDMFGAWVQFDNPKADDGLWFVVNTSMEKV